MTDIAIGIGFTPDVDAGWPQISLFSDGTFGISGNGSEITLTVSGSLHHDGTYTMSTDDLGPVPFCLKAPLLSGEAEIGTTVTVIPGLWLYDGSVPGFELAYEWQLDGVAVGTGLSYEAQSADAGGTLMAVESLTGSGADPVYSDSRIAGGGVATSGFSDNFTAHPDELNLATLEEYTALMGTGGYLKVSGGLAVTSNTTTNRSLIHTGELASDQFAEVEIAQAGVHPAQVGLYVRATDVDNHYALFAVNDTQLRLQKYVSGVKSILNTYIDNTLVNGSTLRLEAEASALRVRIDDIIVYETTDGDLLSGKAGFLLSDSNSLTPFAVDRFECGEI